MSSAPVMQQRWVKWGLFVALWTLIGTAFSSQYYLYHANSGSPVAWKEALAHSLADWYLFALLSLPVLWLARRFRFERLHWPPRLAIHLLASAIFSVAWMVLRLLIEQWFIQSGENQVTFKTAFTAALFTTFFFNLFIYWAILSVSHSVEYYRKYRERELRTAELE